MAQNFTLREAIRLLNVDNKTFAGWLEESHIFPQEDRSDKRKKLLTLDQLKTLAAKYQRVLPLEKIDADPLAALEARLLAEIRRLEREIKRLERRLEETPPGAHSEARQTASPVPEDEAPTRKMPAVSAPPQHPRRPEPLLAMQAMRALLRVHFAPGSGLEPERIGSERVRNVPSASQATLTGLLIEAWRPLSGFHRCEQKGCPCQR